MKERLQKGNVEIKLTIRFTTTIMAATAKTGGAITTITSFGIECIPISHSSLLQKRGP